MRKAKTKKKLLDWMMSDEYRKLKEEVIENSKNNYAATMALAARRQIIGGGAPINKSWRRRPQIVGGGGAAHRSSWNVICPGSVFAVYVIRVRVGTIGDFQIKLFR